MLSKRYIQVILPLRLEWEPCYCLDGTDTSAQVQVGDRVRVCFSRKEYVAVVSAVDVEPDISPEKISAVSATDTGLAPITAEELELWRFIASYYLCTVGEVYKAAYPLPKIKSEQTALRSEQRRAQMLAAQESLWKERISRLLVRLEAKDQALSRKHKSEVAARLREERMRIASELEAAKQRLESIGSGELFQADSSPVITPRKSVLWQKCSTSKPVLYKAADRLEEYIAVASNCFASGRSVLVLVPETALAKQLEERFREAFAGALLVYHSSETTARRRSISDRVRREEPFVLLGTRSSLLLPLSKLGLVIVENEQSPFYKQTDSSPRYNARDVAVVLGRIHSAAVVLGSPSPSLESELNASSGRYDIIEGPIQRVPFEMIDISSERRKNGMLGCFSRKLAAECKEGEIALIRGFEKEEELLFSISEIFHGEEKRFHVYTVSEASRTDFSSFSLVALLNADSLFRAEDFRSDERAFQLLDSLRFGCRRLIVQTRNPDHQVFSLADASQLLKERKAFSLPPYTRVADILFPEGERMLSFAEGFSRYAICRGFAATDALSRTDGRIFVRITFKRDHSLEERKTALCAAIKTYCRERNYSGNVVVDVDPV